MTPSSPSTEFRALWLTRFGLTELNWEAEVRAKVCSLAFAKHFSEINEELLRYLFRKLPSVYETGSPLIQRMSTAYGWCCLQFWQSLNGFPAFSQNYAQYLKKAITSKASFSNTTAVLLADFLGTASQDGTCGLNRLIWSKPEPALIAEKITEMGSYEDYLSATGRVKYQEYQTSMESDTRLQQDWSHLKTAFPTLTVYEITHRELMPERHWVRDGGAKFDTVEDNFKAMFNLFCWKYYLWGMQGDSPMVLKPSVNITPYGTQLFIPGYMSFDPKRDLDYNKVGQIHRSRGVLRQGKSFSHSQERKKGPSASDDK